MTVPFTDAPFTCVEGDHRWVTDGQDGPIAWCERCGTQPDWRAERRRT